MSQQSLFDEDRPRPSGQAPEAEGRENAGTADQALVSRPYTPEERHELMTPVRAEALVCTRCELAQTRSNVVFGEGNINTPLVLVGEGPGETEDATGRPFVGR